MLFIISSFTITIVVEAPTFLVNLKRFVMTKTESVQGAWSCIGCIAGGKGESLSFKMHIEINKKMKYIPVLSSL